MKKISILLLALTISISSCKQEPKLNYKYNDKDSLFSCSGADMDLIKDATYAFEDFILKNYDYSKNGDINLAYRSFLTNARHDIIPMAERLDDHTISIIKALKNEENLWIISEHPKLNYKAALTSCISNTIENEQFKKVFTALASSSTLKGSTIAPLILSDLELATKDKSVATYIALDMFYAKLINLDYTLSKEELSNVVKQHNQSHAGHNH